MQAHLQYNAISFDLQFDESLMTRAVTSHVMTVWSGSAGAQAGHVYDQHQSSVTSSTKIIVGQKELRLTKRINVKRTQNGELKDC